MFYQQMCPIKFKGMTCEEFQEKAHILFDAWYEMGCITDEDLDAIEQMPLCEKSFDTETG